MKKLLTLILIISSIGIYAQQPGNSLNFDGINDYVTLGDNDGMTAITIETWLYYQQDALQFICSKGNEHLEIHTNTGGNLRFIPVAGVYIDATNVLSISQWAHIACVYDPSASLAKIYINGAEVPVVKLGASPLTTPLANNTTNFNIGRRADNTFYFKGNFDELRIWNVARTAQEIADNFTVAINPTTETNLVSYYNFNQGTAGGNNTAITSLTDLKGSFNGTFNNFALNGASSNFAGSYAMTIPVANALTNSITTSFTANWTAPTIGIVDNYLLFVASNSDFTNPVTGYNPLIVNATTFSAAVTGLTSGNRYFYRVAAKNNTLSMISANSNSIIFGTSVSQNSFLFKQEGESKNCEIYSDRNWTATSSETWLTLNTTSGTGNQTLILTAAENNSGFNRTATISISSQNQNNDIIINVTQKSITGEGTVADPYKIYSYNQLCQIDDVNYSWSAVYELMNDIDASASQTQNGGAGFLPIGNYPKDFTGQFYGNGHTISNLYINRPNENGVGIFLQCMNAIIKDLNLINIYVSGNSFVGGLAGIIQNCTIGNCHVNGNIIGISETGGLIGSSYTSNISNCYVKGKVSGSENVGGLCGYIYENSISNCFSYADVTGSSVYIGGFFGYGEYGLVENCFSTGNIYGIGQRIGGFCGNAIYINLINCYSTGNVYSNNFTVGGFTGSNSEAVISNCYSTGDVNGNQWVGGFAGTNNNQIINSFSTGKVFGDINVASFSGNNSGSINWGVSNSQLSGQSVFTNGGTQTNCYMKNTEEMKKQSTYSGFDFGVNWQIRENQTYPALKGINNAPFAFADTISKHSMNFSFSELLANDYDYETLQTALCLKIISVEAGTYDNSNVIFSNGFPLNTPRKVVYRVGEIISAGDTLWGNRAEAVLTVTNTKPVINSFDNLSTLMNTPIRVLPANINFTDAENDQIQEIMFLQGENYGFVGTSILPAYNFVGELHVPVKISDGFEWSDSLIMTITVTPSNYAPIAYNSNISTRQAEAITTIPNATDEDGYVTNLYIHSYPQHGTIGISDLNITFTPNPTFSGNDEFQYFVKDNNGAFSNIATISIEITQNNSPVIISTAPTTAIAGEEYSYEVIATDAEGDELTYSLSNAPAGMIITDNLITWTPTQGTTNSGIVTLTVSDGTFQTTELFIVYVASQFYQLTTSVSPVNSGSISVLLTAIPQSNYIFINWTENGNIISTEATYEFSSTGSRELVANFELENNISQIENSGITVFPNPTSGKLIVKVKN